jgi:type II secretory pathway pseudopilin PulG
MRAHPILRFTMIEVVVVVTVLLLLAGLLLPVLHHSREKAKRVNCAGNLKQKGLILLMYSGDFDGYFPNVNPIPTNNFEPLGCGNYLHDVRVWSCPSRRQELVLDARAADYRYIGSGLKDDNKSATSVSLAYDQSGNHPRNAWCNVLFIQGFVAGGSPAKEPAKWGND